MFMLLWFTLAKKLDQRWTARKPQRKLANSTLRSIVYLSSFASLWSACPSWSYFLMVFRVDGISTSSDSSFFSLPLSLSRSESTSTWLKCTTHTVSTKMRTWRTLSRVTLPFRKNLAESNSCLPTRRVHWLRTTWFSRKCQWSGPNLTLNLLKTCKLC